jgi:chemotaxis methyl-accepting protein methylase
LDVLKSLKNSEKCHVVQGDFLENLEPIRNADIVLMNNVFTFFADHDTQTKCWQVLQQTIPAGSFLVHAHSVKAVTSHLRLDFDVDEWLELVSDF